MKNLLISALLTGLSFSSLAANLQPSANAESELYPAANNCGMESARETPVAYPYKGGYQVTEGFIMSCSLPVKPGKYIERIVLDHYASGMENRACSVGFVRAASGGTVTNQMTRARDGNVDVWYYDDLGSSEAYSGGNPHNTLLLTCQHYNFVNNSFVRYGVIRVDYTPN